MTSLKLNNMMSLISVEAIVCTNVLGVSGEGVSVKNGLQSPIYILRPQGGHSTH